MAERIPLQFFQTSLKSLHSVVISPYNTSVPPETQNYGRQSSAKATLAFLLLKYPESTHSRVWGLGFGVWGLGFGVLWEVHKSH